MNLLCSGNYLHYICNDLHSVYIVMLGKIEGRKRRGQHRLDGITDSMGGSLSKFLESEGQGRSACCSPWGRRVKHDLATERQSIIRNLEII